MRVCMRITHAYMCLHVCMCGCTCACMYKYYIDNKYNINWIFRRDIQAKTIKMIKKILLKLKQNK